MPTSCSTSRTASSPPSRRRCEGARREARRAGGHPPRRRSGDEAARPIRMSGSTRCSSRGSSADRRRAQAAGRGATCSRKCAARPRLPRRPRHCGQRELVTTHAAFGYLAARYGLKQVAITGIDPESEPAPRSSPTSSRLVARPHETIFFETPGLPRLADTVAREAGATTAVLDPVEGLTPGEATRATTTFR